MKLFCAFYQRWRDYRSRVYGETEREAVSRLLWAIALVIWFLVICVFLKLVKTHA